MHFSLIANMICVGIILTTLIVYCVVTFAGYRRFSFTTVTFAVLGTMLLADRILSLFNMRWVDCFERLLLLIRNGVIICQ